MEASEEMKRAMQSALDKVWDWFVVQKKPQSKFANTCMYRGPKGKMCAIGLLIPNNEYTDSLEGGTSADARRACPSLQQYPDSFLEQLQSAHDDVHSGEFAECIKPRLRAIARVYGLQVVV